MRIMELRSEENCQTKTVNFSESQLGIEHAKNIKIDRAHRLVPFKPGKTRPIVVKYNYFPDKMAIKQAGYDKLR